MVKFDFLMVCCFREDEILLDLYCGNLELIFDVLVSVVVKVNKLDLVGFFWIDLVWFVRSVVFVIVS